MTMQTKTIGRMSTDHGPWVPGTVAGKKFCYQLFGCTWESLHDNNNTAPAVWDGGDTITPNLVDWKKESGSYEAWLMNHDKPATSEQYPYNGMGRVRLQKNIVNNVNTLTQAMLTQQNTVYVIQYDFTLTSDVTVPANCVLEFDGGSLSGSYEIDLNGCYLKGDAHFGTGITFSGNIRNGSFNVLWLDDSDFGAKMNRAALYFKDLYVPAGEITYSTPININLYPGNLHCEASLIYDGTLTNNEAAFKIYGLHSKIYINELQRVGGNHPVGIDYSKNRIMNFIGLKVHNSIYCDISINFISGFNEGIRFEGLGAGCSDNRIYVSGIWNYNFGVRIFQGKRSTDNRDGWCNGINISGGCWRSMDNTIEEKHAVCIAGALYGSDTYRDTSLTNPTNNGSSRNTIHDLNFENHSYPIYVAGTINYINIYNCREENCTGLFYCPDNATFNVNGFYKPGYSNCLRSSYYTKIDSFGVSDGNDMQYFYLLRKTEKLAINAQYNNTWIAGEDYLYSIYSQQLTDGASYSTGLYHGKLFYCDGLTNIVLNTSVNIHGRAVFFDENMNNVSDTIYNEESFNSTIYYRSQDKAYVLGSNNYWNVPIPKGAKYIFIGISLQASPNNDVHLEYYSLVQPVVKNILNTGTTEQRPSSANVGFNYYDTTLGKMIFNLGTKWIDANGTVV